MSMLYSVPIYWLANFQPTATAFFRWVIWLFLDLFAAESLVILICSVWNEFRASLIATIIANGLWICVGGILIPPYKLNVFWRYSFHLFSYQTWIFRALMANEFENRVFTCEAGDNGTCSCMYSSILLPQCLVDGNAVLSHYGSEQSAVSYNILILLAIISTYRLLAWIILKAKNRSNL
ncbi:hypothetical protein M433DRAFT_209163 [Acidomyces richmondensis BFW]|nr:hypothetical protein M433DRAFT_209163 [Acidomyces richmondensis BFW]